MHLFRQERLISTEQRIDWPFTGWVRWESVGHRWSSQVTNEEMTLVDFGIEDQAIYELQIALHNQFGLYFDDTKV